MLVLSRRENEKVHLPDLGVTIQILGIKASNVRIGIDAPAEVRIVRDELIDGDAAPQSRRTHVIRLPASVRHALRNDLNSLSVALHLFRQEVAAGLHRDADETFDVLVEYLERLSNSDVLSPHGVAADDKAGTEDAQPSALLVDDADNEREMLAGFLRLQGYRVDTAADGIEALEYLQSHVKPSFMLIDMRMPRCDGATVVRRIRDNPAFDDVKIFAISGSTAAENQLNDRRDGVNQWFMKPLNPRSLVDAMSASISRPDLVAV